MPQFGDVTPWDWSVYPKQFNPYYHRVAVHPFVNPDPTDSTTVTVKANLNLVPSPPVYRNEVRIGNISIHDTHVVQIVDHLDGPDRTKDLLRALAREFGTTVGEFIGRISNVLADLREAKETT